MSIFYDKRNPKFIILASQGVRNALLTRNEFYPLTAAAVSQILHFKRNNERAMRVRNWVMNHHTSMLVNLPALKKKTSAIHEETTNDTGETV